MTEDPLIRPLAHRVFDEIQKRLWGLDPDQEPAEAATPVPQQAAVELELERLRISVDFALTGAHWESDARRRTPVPCTTCGQEQPCATVRSLAAKYRVG